MVAEPVKADSTSLSIPLDSLLRLPLGASYTARSGRAHVSAQLKRSGDRPATVYIETGCDSLERLCAYYEQENERLSVSNSHLKNTVTHEEKEEKTSLRGWVELLWTFIAGLMLGGLITIVTRKIWQKVF